MSESTLKKLNKPVKDLRDTDAGGKQVYTPSGASEVQEQKDMWQELSPRSEKMEHPGYRSGS